MADKTLKSIKFPGLPDRYVVPTDASNFTYNNENLEETLDDLTAPGLTVVDGVLCVTYTE